MVGEHVMNTFVGTKEHVVTKNDLFLHVPLVYAKNPENVFIVFIVFIFLALYICNEKHRARP